MLQLVFDDSLVQNYGAPEAAEVLLKFPHANDGRQSMEVELTLINKQPTRLGESLFFTFNPALGGDWFMDKLGERVSPLEVVDGGSRGLHGITSGVLYEMPSDGSAAKTNMSVFIESLDAGIVVWSKPDPFPSPIHKQPDLNEGVSFMLFNNVWNTNYQYWYPSSEADKNSVFRFNVTFDGKSPLHPVHQ